MLGPMKLATCVLVLACVTMGCDEEKADPIVRGQSYVDQARAVSAGDHEQKIALAETMIEAGKLQDAESLLDQISAQSLSAEGRDKLDAAREKLKAAKSR